jgi:hypothetical protein
VGEYVYVLSEQEERAALAEVFTESEVAKVTRTRRAPAPYTPTAADLEAQAAADHEQEQAERDYRELARLALPRKAAPVHAWVGQASVPRVSGRK